MSAWLNDTTSWGAIVGVATPLLVAAVNQPTWSPHVRQGVAFLAAILLGVGTALAEGKIDQTSTVLSTIAAVAVTSAISYRAVLGKWAGLIERATSPTPPSNPDPYPPAGTNGPLR